MKEFVEQNIAAGWMDSLPCNHEDLDSTTQLYFEEV